MLSSRRNIHGTRRLAVIHSSPNTASETFIRAHCEQLPAQVTVIHKGNAELPHVGNRPVLQQNVLARATRKASRILRNRSWNWEITAGYVKALRTNRCDAVLAEYGTAAVEVMEACKISGVPLIAHFHGFDASIESILKAFRDDYRRLFDTDAAIIAVSSPMRQTLLELGACPDRTHLNIYGVDVDRFQQVTPSENAPTILAVGRLVEKKAPQLTILAFHSIANEFPDARLRIIGDGPLMHVCRTIVSALQIDSRVDFLGVVPHERIAKEMQKARIFAQHSMRAANGDSEGTPNSVLEAGATGLPVVATRHAGIPDVVIDGTTGLLCDENDVYAMADHFRKLLRNPMGGDELGRRARRWIESSLTSLISIRRLWSVIEAAIERRVIEPLKKTEYPQADRVVLK